jgi:soluble lytic murein transglycosylase-like protein
MSVADMVVAAAQQQGLDPALALEVASAESNFNPNAVSPAGAIGVMQLMPATAAQLGVDPYDAAQNIQGGVTYLRQLLAQFGDPVAAVAAYNCGPGCVRSLQASYGSDWLAHAPAETRNYVARIVGNVTSSYAASLTPTISAPPVITGSVLTIPQIAQTMAPSVWQSAAIAAAVILGLGYVLEQT